AREDFAGIRTGRVTPAMFNKITAEYYGTPTPIQQLASFHVPEPRMVIIQPYDKSSMGAIERAIRDSDLGVNPGNDGQGIRVVFPGLSEGRRKEKTEIARSKAESGRAPVRNSRRHAQDTVDEMNKDGDAGEDGVRRAEKELDDLTQMNVAKIDELLKHREAE